MLEIIIIICLSFALFLLLRHYPEAKGLNLEAGKSNLKRVFSYLKKFKREKNYKAIEAIISDGQENIIAPAEIEDASRRFEEEDPDLAQLLLQANEAFTLNDLRVAEDKALEVVIGNKRSAQAYLLLGKIAFMRGQYEDAKEALKTALRCNNDMGEAHFYLGKIEYRNDNLSGAIDSFQKSIYAEKGHADWYAELGKAYMEVRQYAKAAKVLKRASSLDIDNLEYKNLASEAEDKQRTHSLYSRNK